MTTETYFSECMIFNLSMSGILQNREPRQCRPKSFGEIHDNYNWIECASAKNPDQNYYFNVRSHCRTWTRPVPENVDLPFFNPHLIPPPTSENENDSSPPVSELDDTPYQDNEEYEEIENQNQNEKQIFEIASKLFYHGCRNSRRSRRKIVEDISEEDSPFYETLPITDFLEVQYLSEDSAKRLRSASSSSSESSEESDTESSKESTSSSCHCSCCDVPKENSDGDSRSYESSTSYQSFSSNFSAPRLKEITFSDLMTEPRKKLRRRRKKCKIETSKKLTPDKRICDMYGIRTISYDPIFEYINPILPNNVQPACLTDSSNENSPSRPKAVSNIDLNTLFDLPIHIEDPILSEVSSGSETTEPLEDLKYMKEVSPSKIIWRPWDEKKKSYEDILGRKLLCIKLQRIDLDKNYFSAKDKKKDHQMEKGKKDSTITEKPKRNGNKKNLSEDNSESETAEVSEVKKRKEDRRHKKKVDNFKKESSEENWEIEKDNSTEENSEVEDRLPRRLRPKRNTVIYVEPDTDEEYFEIYNPSKFFENKIRTTGKSHIGLIDTKGESDIEERDENRNKITKDTINDKHSKVHSESEENSKVEEKVRSKNTKENSFIEENSETEDSEREDSSGGNYTDENNQICSIPLEKEGNDNYGWVIVNSEINKMRLKKIFVNSVSPDNEKINNLKADVEEEKTKEVPEVQDESANKIQENEVTDGKIQNLRVDFDRSKVEQKFSEIKDSERPPETISEDLMLIEKLKTLNSFTLVTKELTDSAELRDKVEEIKSQENECQIGEKPMELYEEEDKFIGIKDDRSLQMKLEDLTKKTKTVSFESLNAFQSYTRELNLQEINSLESLISSFSMTQTNSEELRNKVEEIKCQENETQIGEKPMELDEEEDKFIGIKDDRLLQMKLEDLTEKRKTVSFESLNACKSTTRELNLQEINSFESLIFSVSSTQTDSAELRDKVEEIKSQENESQIGEKPMELDEEEDKFIGIKDDRSLQMKLEDLTEKRKTVSFESLNACKSTTRELNLQEANFLKSSISSISSTQTDSAELRNRVEEIKSQENETQIGEKPMELDEEEDKFIGIKDDRSLQMKLEDLTEKRKTVSFESLNACKSTTRELNLQEANFLKSSISSISSIQTDSMNFFHRNFEFLISLRDKVEEIKSRANESQIGEKPMELDEEEEKFIGIKDDRSPEIKLEDLTEKTKTVSCESLNACKSNTRELNLQEINSLESLISSVSSTQTNSEELRDKVKEIKSQENETQIGEKSMELDEEEDKFIGIKNDKSPEIKLEDLTEKTKTVSSEALNACKSTTRELNLQEANFLKSSISSISSTQTTSEESAVTKEEIKSQENGIQNRKKSMELVEEEELLLFEGDQIEEGEISIDFDEEELLLMENDQNDDKQKSIDLDEEELLLMEDEIEGAKPLNINEDEDEVFIIKKESDKSPEKKPIDIERSGSKILEAENPRDFSGIGKKKDERSKKLPLIERGNEPEIVLSESDNQKKELLLIKNGNKKPRTKKRENEKMEKKDMDEEELSSADTCSTLVELNSNSEDEDDESKTEVAEDQILSETDTVLQDRRSNQSSNNSDTTQVCSELESD